VALLQGLVRIAQPPQGHGGIRSGSHPGALSVAEGMGTVPLGVVEGDPLRQMGLGSGELAQIVQGQPEGIVGLHAERRIADPLG
jgi:hypothetical protein